MSSQLAEQIEVDMERKLNALEEARLAETLLVEMKKFWFEHRVLIPVDVLTQAQVIAGDVFLPSDIEVFTEEELARYESMMSKWPFPRRSEGMLVELSAIGKVLVTQWVLWFLMTHAKTHNVSFTKSLLTVVIKASAERDHIGIEINETVPLD